MSLGFAEVNTVDTEVAPWLRQFSQSESFQRTQPTRTAGEIIDAREIFREKVIERVPIWRFTEDELNLRSKKAIIINVCRSMNHYFAENETLNIFATGDSYLEAIEAFKEHILYFYQHFKSLSSEEVTGEAAEMRESFAELFVENE